MPEEVKPTAPAAQPAEQGSQQQQAPATQQSPKEANADKVAKAQQGAAAFLAKKLLEGNKPREKPEEKAEKKDEAKHEADPKDQKEDKAEGEKKEEDKKPEPKPKAERKKPTETEQPRGVDANEIAEAAARGVAKALQGERKSDAKPSKEYTKDDLPPEFAEVYDELVELPKLGGDWKDRNVVAEVVEASRAIDKYKSTWQKKNKGQEFDPSDEEHADFMSEHSIEIPQQALIKAARLVAEGNATKNAVAKVREELGGDIDELRTQKKLSGLRPVVDQVDSSVDEAIAESVGDDVVAALKKGGDEVKKLSESHPYLSDVAAEVAPIANSFASVAIKVLGDVEKFDPQNRMHRQFQQDIIQIENQLAGQESPPKLKDGREFATLEEWGKLSPGAQRRYYTVAELDAIPVVVRAFTKAVADNVASGWKARHERWSKNGSGRTNASSGTPSEQKQEHKSSPTVTPTASKIPEPKAEGKAKSAPAFMANLLLGKKPA